MGLFQLLHVLVLMIHQATIILVEAQNGCTTFSYPPFDTTSNLLFGGDAQFNEDNAITEVNLNTGTGIYTDTRATCASVLYGEPLQMLGKDSSFTTTFTFSIAGTNSAGFAFVLLPQNHTTGLAGCKLCLMPENLDATSSQFFAVEFDTFKNLEFNDTSNNHVGVNINSMNSTVSYNLCGDGIDECTYLVDGISENYLSTSLYAIQNFTSWIEYDSVTKTLAVFLTNGSTVLQDISKPTSAIIKAPVDLSDVMTDNMFVGFTASTNNYDGEAKKITSWSFSTSARLTEAPSPLGAINNGTSPGINGPPSRAPGLSPGNIAPVLSPDNIAPGLSPGNIEPGLSPDNIAPGLSPGNIAPVLSPDNIAPGLSPGNIAPGLSPDNIAPGLSPGNIAPGLSPDNIAPGLSPGNIAPGLSPGNIAPGLSPGNIVSASSTGGSGSNGSKAELAVGIVVGVAVLLAIAIGYKLFRLFRRPLRFFLSHAGGDDQEGKNFPDWLRDTMTESWKLKRFIKVFSDRRSLETGRRFPDQIKQALEKTEVGIVVVTPEFFTRKWPMTELISFVRSEERNPAVRILPLWYQMTVTKVKEDLRAGKWNQAWTEMSKEGNHPLPLEDCLKAVKRLCEMQGVSYTANSRGHDREYIKQILKEVGRILRKELWKR